MIATPPLQGGHGVPTMHPKSLGRVSLRSRPSGTASAEGEDAGGHWPQAWPGHERDAGGSAWCPSAQRGHAGDAAAWAAPLLRPRGPSRPGCPAPAPGASQPGVSACPQLRSLPPPELRGSTMPGGHRAPEAPGDRLLLAQSQVTREEKRLPLSSGTHLVAGAIQPGSRGPPGG